VPRVEQRVSERADEDALDELVHQLPAAAVREQNLRVLLDG
jgi:hypothetical protein